LQRRSAIDNAVRHRLAFSFSAILNPAVETKRVDLH
jgi:hypothetical protein